jgi:hypothetical protein
VLQQPACCYNICIALQALSAAIVLLLAAACQLQSPRWRHYPVPRFGCVQLTTGWLPRSSPGQQQHLHCGSTPSFCWVQSCMSAAAPALWQHTEFLLGSIMHVSSGTCVVAGCGGVGHHFCMHVSLQHRLPHCVGCHVVHLATAAPAMWQHTEVLHMLVSLKRRRLLIVCSEPVCKLCNSCTLLQRGATCSVTATCIAASLAHSQCQLMKCHAFHPGQSSSSSSSGSGSSRCCCDSTGAA